MRRVRKGFSRVETLLFEGMLVTGEPEGQGDAEEQVQGNDNDAAQGADTAISGDDEALDACAALTRRVEYLEHDKVAQALEITKLKKMVKKLERANKVKVLKLRILKKVGTSQRIESSADTDMKDASNQGRMIADLDKDTGVALMDDEGTENKAKDAQVAVTSASATIAVVPAATITAAPVRVATASTRRRKRVVIKDPEVESTAVIPAETKSKDNGKGIMIEEPKPMKKKQHSKEQLEEEENMAIESINETPAQKAAKRRKLNEEVEDLKQHLEIVPDEDDDMYTEATPLTRKRMFKRPDGQDQVWKNQRTVHGQARVKSWKLLESCGVHIITFTTTQLILLVERRYPLSRFTLDQMLNVIRLRVEEHSEMYLELLSEELSAAKQKLMMLDTTAERRLMLLSQVKTVNEKCCC
nr:hypothetical protein [Tanacetum cinerariifolium]